MKGLDLIIVVLLSALLHSNADVSESRNLKLPFNSLERIPSPLQSLLPPTFENPVKDYTVGLVPPPVESAIQQAPSGPAHLYQNVQVPVHSHIPNYDTRVVNPVLQLQSAVQPKGRQSIGSMHAIHHQTQAHYSASRLQPQAVVHPQYQRANSYHDHHRHQQQQQLNTYVTGFQHTHHSVPVTQSAVYQHSAHTLHRQPAHAHVHHVHTARVQQSDISSRPPVLPNGVRIIQSYPSVSFEATVPLHGSTLSLRNANLEPELVSIIREVLHRHDF